jgi:hypothetical protein
MIAIFKTEKEAVDFEIKVNQHLKDNRHGYNAERWSDLDKSATEELWAVPIPEDYDRWDKKITLDFTIYTYMADFPEGWHPIPEMI